MMLAPLANNARRGPTYRSASMPAPVKGWNTKDALSNMDPAFAIILDNVVPSPSDVALRRGMDDHVTGLGASVETLAAFSGPSSRVLLGAAGGSIYNVTSAGAVGAAIATGKTSNRWQTTMFSTSGGNFLFMVNGADDPIYYDGSTFTTPSLTGITPADCIGVMAHQSRLFFLLKDSSKVGYLAVASIAGAVTTFDLGNVFDLGGKVVAMGSWTRDGGSGPDDVACFFSSNGQVALFSGNDPGDATAWEKVGTFNIGAPIGNRGVFKLGSDLVVITQDGFIPLSKVLPDDRVNKGASLSDNIQPTVLESARSYGANFGWQCIHYPKASLGIFNVPISSTVFHQYVVNTQNGAWCRFTGWNGASWAVFNNNLYFGGTDGKIYLADTGVSDNGATINGDIKPAFSFFGSKGQQKLFCEVRPLIRSNGAIPIAIDLNVDYENISPTSVPTAPALDAAVWDTAVWDTDVWGGEDQLVSPIIGVTGIGTCATPRMRISTSEMTFSLAGYDILWQPGNFM